MAVEALSRTDTQTAVWRVVPVEAPKTLPQPVEEVVVYTHPMADSYSSEHDSITYPGAVGKVPEGMSAKQLHKEMSAHERKQQRIRDEVAKDVAAALQEPRKYAGIPVKLPAEKVPPQFQAKRAAFEKATGLNPAEHDSEYIHWLMTNADRFTSYKFNPAKHQTRHETQEAITDAQQLHDVRSKLHMLEGGKKDVTVLSKDTDTTDAAAS
jgi:hypothetical protein